MCREHIDKSSKIKSQSMSNNITCTYCKKVGHSIRQCRALLCFNCKPINKCENCQKLGHKSEDCFLKNKINQKVSGDKRVMVVNTLELNKSKYYKDAVLNKNNKTIKCFLDFGSDCSLIKKRFN